MSLLAMPIRGGLHRPLRRLCRASPRRCIASMSMDGQIHLLSSPLETADPIMFDIIERENKRQKASINLIPSENFTSRGVLDALGSIMQNKYSEGYPGKRYYGGNSVIDEAETLCQHRALETFGLSPAEWGVNVQALSGSPANLYVYSALLKPHDRLMGLDLPHGGHLSHGYQTTTKKISAVSKYFETLPYRLDEQTGYINYDKLEEMAMLYRPKLIVAGATAYSRLIDYKRMRDICDKVNAYMMADIAHLAGMIAAKAIPGPFSFADVVTTTTHKSLRGPRGALIFYRRGDRTGTNARATNSAKLQDSELPAIEPLINASVFPGHQGGPHNHTIAAIAVALRQAQSTDFISYQNQVLANARALARRLGEPRDKGGLGYAIVGGGTDNHMVLIDLKPNGVDGARVERILELVGVAANKNTVPGDRSALVPGGLRIGTPAMTTRGFSEDDFVRVAGLIDRAVVIAGRVDKAARKGADERGATPAAAGRIRTFLDYLGDGDSDSEIVQLRSEVAAWVSTYPLPSDAHL